MESIDRLTAIHYMIGEAMFCLEYSLTAPDKDKDKFWRLGMRVLTNMSQLLIEVQLDLQAIKKK
jgi:hypothetical protein